MFKENELYFLSVLDFYKIEITGETFESKEWLKENNYSWDTNKKVWYKIANIVLDEDKEFERRRLKVNQQKVTDYKLFFSTLLNTIKEEEYTSFVSICKIIKILDTRVFMQNNVEKFLSSLLISDKTKCFRLIVWDKIDSKLIKQEKLYKMRIKYSKRYTNELQLYCESIDDICELSETSDLSFTLKTNEDLQQWIEENSTAIVDVKESKKNVLLNGIITDISSLSQYLGCMICKSKIIENDFCEKCQKEVKTKTHFYLSLILQDKTDAIKINLYTEKVKELLEINDENEFIAPLDYLEKPTLREKIVHLIGSSICVECYVSIVEEEETTFSFVANDIISVTKGSVV